MGIVFMFQDRLLACLFWFFLSLFPPIICLVAVNQTRLSPVVQALAKIANSSQVYIDLKGKGISVDTANRQVVLTLQQKDGFWIYKFPVQNLAVQLFQGTDTPDPSAHGSMQAVGVVVNMMAANQKAANQPSYRLRLTTQDSQYPEHTVDFGASLGTAQLYEAQIRTLIY
jgi:hypothetical protein